MELREYGKRVEIQNRRGQESVCHTLHGKFHRENNSPAVIGIDGDKLYLMQGVFHRDDGPAVIVKDETFYQFYGIKASMGNHYWLYGKQFLKQSGGKQ